ncbi:uncharacterized protein A1O9_11356 [Exophiala aquamarina CBS 119918]|uniref:Fe2OG dioxygenase domain-containing protein n=1 Tax=Exophiala aquamarina CBS 119918 TaxID=1182545 RepID=A0A072NXB4_9EURO|nr:uncharacterized protein A1O9_11356 [Exophiala aquamarina CBS 119918]KEF52514.1 hypothetical protein A1O9_11356 [Exophiala aquamarina CBS 119918]
MTAVAFDAAKHLAYTDRPKVISMKDLGLPEDVGISPSAVSEPFSLFTEDAVRIMRGEVFTKEVWDNCLHSTAFASCQIRGHCPKYAPFMYDAWNDPKTLSIVSDIAGVDLIPMIDYDIGNFNISVQNEGQGKAKLANQSDDDIPITNWHHDSYPFVCVVMMSDASKMVGGETALRNGSGEIIKVRGPQMGSAVVLQGRCISHQALAAVGGGERITMITSFRPRDPMIRDTSVLTSIRPISEPSELYFQWSKYRLEVLQGRVRAMLHDLEETHHENRPTDIKKIKQFLQQQEEWMAGTNAEMVVTVDL